MRAENAEWLSVVLLSAEHWQSEYILPSRTRRLEALRAASDCPNRFLSMDPLERRKKFIMYTHGGSYPRLCLPYPS